MVRIPKGSPAADMRHEELWGNVEHLHSTLDADGNFPEAGLRILRKALTPKADKAPAPAPASAATAAATHRPGSVFLSWSGPHGATAGSPSPLFFGTPRPGHGG